MHPLHAHICAALPVSTCQRGLTPWWRAAPPSRTGGTCGRCTPAGCPLTPRRTQRDRRAARRGPRNGGTPAGPPLPTQPSPGVQVGGRVRVWVWGGGWVRRDAVRCGAVRWGLGIPRHSLGHVASLNASGAKLRRLLGFTRAENHSHQAWQLMEAKGMKITETPPTE